MGITKLSKSGFKSSSYEKYNDFLAGNTAFSPSSYESIATVNITSNTSTITFSSIPSTYTHLQIRSIGRTTRSSTTGTATIRFNNDTASNYAYHELLGTGSSAVADAQTSQTLIATGRMAASTAGSNIFGVQVIDILDYTSTNKNKTVRYLGGADINGGGEMYFGSGLWFKTPEAINRIDITAQSGTADFVQYTQFALYGIKGA
jgi:hypothetical protein